MYEDNIDSFIKCLANALSSTFCDCDKNCKCNKDDENTTSNDNVCKCKKESECCTPKNAQYYKYSKYINGEKVFEKEEEKHDGETIYEIEHDYSNKTNSCLNSSGTKNEENTNKIQVTEKQMEEFVDKVETIEKSFEYYNKKIQSLKKENKNLRTENDRLCTFISKLQQSIGEIHSILTDVCPK